MKFDPDLVPMIVVVVLLIAAITVFFIYNPVHEGFEPYSDAGLHNFLATNPDALALIAAHRDSVAKGCTVVSNYNIVPGPASNTPQCQPVLVSFQTLIQPVIQALQAKFGSVPPNFSAAGAIAVAAPTWPPPGVVATPPPVAATQQSITEFLASNPDGAELIRIQREEVQNGCASFASGTRQAGPNIQSPQCAPKVMANNEIIAQRQPVFANAFFAKFGPATPQLIQELVKATAAAVTGPVWPPAIQMATPMAAPPVAPMAPPMAPIQAVPVPMAPIQAVPVPMPAVGPATMDVPPRSFDSPASMHDAPVVGDTPADAVADVATIVASQSSRPDPNGPIVQPEQVPMIEAMFAGLMASPPASAAVTQVVENNTFIKDTIFPELKILEDRGCFKIDDRSLIINTSNPPPMGCRVADLERIAAKYPNAPNMIQDVIMTQQESAPIPGERKNPVPAAYAAVKAYTKWKATKGGPPDSVKPATVIGSPTPFSGTPAPFSSDSSGAQATVVIPDNTPPGTYLLKAVT